MTKALFDLCDVDRSGTIEMDEFVQVCLTAYTGMCQPLSLEPLLEPYG